MSIEIALIGEIEKHPCLYDFNLPEYTRKDTLDDKWAQIAAKVNMSVHDCKDKWKNIRSSFVRNLKNNGGKSRKPYYLTNYLQFLLPFLKGINVDLSHEEQNNTITIPITDVRLQEVFINENLNGNVHNNAVDDPMIKMEPEFGYHENEDDVISLEPLDNIADVGASVAVDNERLATRKRARHFSSLRSQNIHRHKIKRTNVGISKMRTESNAMKYFLLSLMPELESMDEDQIRLFKIKVMMLIDEIKTDSEKVKETVVSSSEDRCLQKRLINLLLLSLEKK